MRLKLPISRFHLNATDITYFPAAPESCAAAFSVVVVVEGVVVVVAAVVVAVVNSGSK